MTETHQLVYTGPAAFASALVQMLQEQGVTVDWTPPEERRGLGHDAHDIVVNLVATGVWVSVFKGVSVFRDRFKGRGRVDVDPPEKGRHRAD
jgi:hypothetical protein